jgi:hypothetical protein
MQASNAEPPLALAASFQIDCKWAVPLSSETLVLHTKAD